LLAHLHHNLHQHYQPPTHITYSVDYYTGTVQGTFICTSFPYSHTHTYVRYFDLPRYSITPTSHSPTHTLVSGQYG